MAISRVNSRCEAFTIFLPLFHADFRLSAKIPLCRKSDLLKRGNGGFIERDFSPRISTWPVLFSRNNVDLKRKKEEKKKGNENFPRHRRGNTACADHFCLHISFSETCNLYATSLEEHSCEIYPAIFPRDFASHHECKLSSRRFINVDIDRLDFWIRPRIMDCAD